MGRVVAVVLASLVVATAVLMGGASARAASSPTASFTWSVPDRFRDVNGDGVVDEVFNTVFAISNNVFYLDLNACASSGGGSTIVDYLWEFTTAPGQVGVDDAGTSCTHSVQRPANGSWSVKLTVTTADGATATQVQTVRFRDYLIFSIGDSLGSGEGNPEFPCPVPCFPNVLWTPTIPPVPFPNPVQPGWSDTRCHRSVLAGSAGAALQLETSDPHSSVTFVHLACSGAGINVGLINGYVGQQWFPPIPPPDLPPQVDFLQTLATAAARPADAVLVSVGANDVGFGDIVVRCLAPDRCQNDSTFTTKVANDLAALPARYAALATVLNARGVPSERVFLTEYFDPTRDAAGNFGGCVATPLYNLLPSENEWAFNNVITPLNAIVASQGSAQGWNIVGGIAAAFSTHGYCAGAGSSWIRSIEDSIASQGNEDGGFHPNGAGHLFYASRIFQRLKTRFLLASIQQSVIDGGAYQDTVTPTITVDEPSITTMSSTLDGQPYTSGTPVTSPGQHSLCTTVGDALGNSATLCKTFTVTWTTAVTLAGDTSADYHDVATLAARVTHTTDGAAIPGASVSMTVGTQSCAGTTSSTGFATCAITLTQPAGTVPLAASFGGLPYISGSSAMGTFTITREETTVAVTSGLVLAHGSPATVRALLLEDGLVPIDGRSVTFTLGSGGSAQTCSAVTDVTGTASCTIASVSQPLGAGTLTASFAGDAYYLPASETKTTILFAYLATGSFVIGDDDARLSATVSYWGDRWIDWNSLSGGVAPASFMGFATTLGGTPPQSGTTWTTRAGQSSPPTVIPSYMAVVVASTVTQAGALISGNTVKIAIVRTNSDYSGRLGDHATAEVVALQ